DWMVSRTGVGFNSYWHVVRPLQHSTRFNLRLGAHALRLEWDGQQRRVAAVTYRDRTTGNDVRLPASAVGVPAGPLASTGLLLNSTSGDFPNGLGDCDGLLGKYLHEHPRQWFPLQLDFGKLPYLDQAAYLTRAAACDSAPLLAASCTIGFSSTVDKL